jgi:hypothetical protein
LLPLKLWWQQQWISEGQHRLPQNVAVKSAVEREGCRSQWLIPHHGAEGLLPFTRHYSWSEWHNGSLFIVICMQKVLIELFPPPPRLGWECPLGMLPLFGLWYQPWMVDVEFGAVGRIRICRRNRSTQRKPFALYRLLTWPGALPMLAGLGCHQCVRLKVKLPRCTRLGSYQRTALPLHLQLLISVSYIRSKF